MSYYAPGQARFGVGGRFTPMVKRLLIINTGIFIVQLVVDGAKLDGPILSSLGFTPYQVFHGKIWQIFTYMFLHGGVWHLVINMLMLWMFSSNLEEDWGSKRFLHYYLICGVGGGILTLAYPPTWHIPTIGASAAVMGIIVAYGMSYPERRITLLLFFILPITMKAKHLAAGFVFFEFLHCLAGTKDGIGHFAHVGGAVAGFILLKYIWGTSHYGPREYYRPPSWIDPAALFQRLKNRVRRSGEERDEEELDRILGKISTRGMESLSRREIRILKERAMGRRDDDEMRH